MVQILSFPAVRERVAPNPTHGSGWMVQILSTESVSTQRCARSAPEEREGFVSRKDLNEPPTAVGGIRVATPSKGVRHGGTSLHSFDDGNLVLFEFAVGPLISPCA